MKKTSQTVLVLQGGGALGAYQAGVFESMANAGAEPEWLAGVSIGAINAAIIAGNPPDMRMHRLKELWQGITHWPFLRPQWPLSRKDFIAWSASYSAFVGAPGFFRPQTGWAGPVTSYYDTSPLKDTLQRLVDFEYLNSQGSRLTIGAVNVKTGNLTIFDSRKQRLDVRHILASGALPPGFPAVEIDGESYWDGGLVSNTPLQFVLDEAPSDAQLCIFQVDLFSARGQVPATLADVAAREKEIRYSSRTRMNTTAAKNLLLMKQAATRLAAKLPAEWRNDPELKLLLEGASSSTIDIVHLIYRAHAAETDSRDYEFSRFSMDQHWEAGKRDADHSLKQKAWRDQKPQRERFAVMDFGKQMDKAS